MYILYIYDQVLKALPFRGMGGLMHATLAMFPKRLFPKSQWRFAPPELIEVQYRDLSATNINFRTRFNYDIQMLCKQLAKSSFVQPALIPITWAWLRMCVTTRTYLVG